MMHWKQPNWTRILTILLVILATLALLYIAGSVLSRFRHTILLFVLGAITAYVLTPLVNQLEGAFRVRWLAVLLAYAMIAIGIFALGLMLVTPFVQQAQSLVDNLHDPAPSSLKTINQVTFDSGILQGDLQALQRSAVQSVAQGVKPDLGALERRVSDDINVLMGTDMPALRKGTLMAPSHTRGNERPQRGQQPPPNPIPQTQVPPSYADKIEAPLNRLVVSYRQAVQGQTPNVLALKNALADARLVSARAADVRHIMSTTPILLLRSQTWLDGHRLRIDLHDKFGDAAGQISSQGSNILDNAITILSETVNILLNITLILIIAFYLLLDGRRIIRGGLQVVPENYRERVWYFVTSLDKVMGGYIRGQLFLSTLAGILGGGGAAVLHVPYPLLIGIVTFLLESVPVIGPMVAMFPAVIISLFFMPPLTTAILAAWFIVFQQVVTNILGPRIMGIAVGIHPLEALLAVLVGYPIGGFLGAFLAVPVMGIFHILIRESYAYFVLGQSMPVAAVPVDMEESSPAPSVAATSQRVAPRAKTDSAAG